ncbi:MAG TPA: hypothetical protein VN851_07830 [Thermoanaerobaculia bacterium]|nr:hypothetical protein [Thermoanaerobaculia bacterium]
MSGLEMFYSYSILAIPVLFVATFLVDRAFRRDLRNRHPETWASLRSSRPLSVRPMANSLGFQRYLWTSRYRDLDDPALNQMASWLKGLSVVYVVSFLLVLVVLMTHQGQLKPHP